MRIIFSLFFCLLIYLVSTGNVSSGPCPLINNQAKCSINVGNIPVQVSIIVNQCHQPVDSTFTLKVQDPQLEWKHTFVLTNAVESQEVLGFPERLQLHVTTTPLEDEEVLLTAQFLALDENHILLTNTTVLVKELQHCKYMGSMYVSRVVAGVMMPLLLLVLSVGSFLLYCKCRKSTMDQLTLVENMAGLPGASPYQEGQPVISFHKQELAENELIIENSFVTSRNESTA